MDLVMFLLSIGIIHPLGINYATKGGHLSLVKYLYYNGLNTDNETINMCCISNNIVLLQFLLTNNVYYDQDLLYDACFYNCKLDFIIHILENCNTYKPYTTYDLYSY